MSTTSTSSSTLIPRELVDRIDRLRGLAPRAAYIRYLLAVALELEERKPR